MQSPQIIILLGRSGCGKGTQAELLMEHFGDFYYISTGDLLRALASQDTDTGEKIKKIINEGGLPFDDLATTLWMHEVAFNVKKGQSIIFDGAPRRLPEAENLDRFLEFLERKDSAKVLLIDISRQEAFNRLTKRRICKSCQTIVPFLEPYKNWTKCEKCGGELIERVDDTPEAIKNRLDYFDERVSEVIEYYQSQNRLIKINGERPIEEVHQDILEKIK